MPVKYGCGMLFDASTGLPFGTTIGAGEFNGVYHPENNTEVDYMPFRGQIEATLTIDNNCNVWRLIGAFTGTNRRVAHLCKFGKYRVRKKNQHRIENNYM